MLVRGVVVVNDLDGAKSAVVRRNEDAMGDATMEIYMRLGGDGRCWLYDYGGVSEGARDSA